MINIKSKFFETLYYLLLNPYCVCKDINCLQIVVVIYVKPYAENTPKILINPLLQSAYLSIPLLNLPIYLKVYCK